MEWFIESKFFDQAPHFWWIGKENRVGFEWPSGIKIRIMHPRVSLSEFLPELAYRFGEEEARKRALRIFDWFDTLKECLIEELDDTLRYDIFFGFVRMLSWQHRWKIFQNQSRNAQEYYYKLVGIYSQHVKENDHLTTEMKQKSKQYVDEWRYFGLFAMGGLMHEKLASHFYGGGRGRKMPEINKKIAAYLKNSLGAKLKGARARMLRTPKKRDRISNDLKAARKLRELGELFGVKLESEPRLRNR